MSLYHYADLLRRFYLFRVFCWQIMSYLVSTRLADVNLHFIAYDLRAGFTIALAFRVACTSCAISLLAMLPLVLDT